MGYRCFPECPFISPNSVINFAESRHCIAIIARTGTPESPDDLLERQSLKVGWQPVTGHWNLKNKDELFVEDLVNAEVIASPQLRAHREDFALSNAAILDRLISRDGTHAAIIYALTMNGE